MLVYIAHTGRVVECDVQSSSRVEVLQHMLAKACHVPLEQQILMCEGRRLDAHQTLVAYGLPEERTRGRDVYLYCRSHLRPGGSVAPEALEPLQVNVLDATSIPYDPHLLQLSPSPLYRVLVDYERHFRHHIAEAEAFVAGAQQRYEVAQRYIAEQRVQLLAISAAVANVESHFRYIRDAYAQFMAQHRTQSTAHASILSGFANELESLAAFGLHPQVATAEHRRLLDLLPETKLRQWAEYCRKSHVQFGDKVRELDRLYSGLHTDVESLLMQAPTSAVNQLTEQLAHVKTLVDDQGVIVNALRNDFQTVAVKVEEWARIMAVSSSSNRAGQSAGSGSGGSSRAGTPASVDMEELRGLEEINCVHLNELLPRVRSVANDAEALAQACVKEKNTSTAFVLDQLQRISSQQSKIRDMRNKLAAFKEVATKQDDAFAQLGVIKRVPAAYKQCLAECVRRQAFGQLYSGQAGQLAEKMGRMRDKEVARREAFKKQVERLIPSAVLLRMGLLQAPSHCQVHMPASDGHLLHVTIDDVQQLSLPDAAPAAGEGPGSRPGTPAGTEAKGPLEGDEQDEDTTAGLSGHTTLELENARLRAELAHHIAKEPLQRASTTPAATPISPRAGLYPAPSADMLSSVASLTPIDVAASLMLQRPAPPLPGGALGDTPPGSEAAWREAVALKDAYIDKLQQQLQAFSKRCRAYERRITALEARQEDEARRQAAKQAVVPQTVAAAPSASDALLASVILSPAPSRTSSSAATRPSPMADSVSVVLDLGAQGQQHLDENMSSVSVTVEGRTDAQPPPVLPSAFALQPQPSLSENLPVGKQDVLAEMKSDTAAAQQGEGLGFSAGGKGTDAGEASASIQQFTSVQQASELSGAPAELPAGSNSAQDSAAAAVDVGSRDDDQHVAVQPRAVGPVHQDKGRQGGSRAGSGTLGSSSDEGPRPQLPAGEEGISQQGRSSDEGSGAQGSSSDEQAGCVATHRSSRQQTQRALPIASLTPAMSTGSSEVDLPSSTGEEHITLTSEAAPGQHGLVGGEQGGASDAVLGHQLVVEREQGNALSTASAQKGVPQIQGHHAAEEDTRGADASNGAEHGQQPNMHGSDVGAQHDADGAAVATMVQAVFNRICSNNSDATGA